MQTLNSEALMQVNGGLTTVTKYVIGGIAAGVAFIASVIYGYIHPVKCS